MNIKILTCFRIIYFPFTKEILYRVFNLSFLFLFSYDLSFAQVVNYPTRPIQFIVPFPAGSLTDVIAREVAEKASIILKQPIIIENRTGANGVIGAKYVMNSHPDGYNILINSNSHVANYSLFKVPHYNPNKDFAPITRIVGIPFVLMVRADLPVKTLSDLISLAKKNPSKLTYGSGNTSSRATVEFLKIKADIDLRFIPYRGMPQAMIDLMSSTIDLVITDTSYILEHGSSGKIRSIAVTTNERIPQLLAVPTFIESGMTDYEMVGWIAAFASKNTSSEIITKLNNTFVQILNEQDLKIKFEKLGTYSSPTTPSNLNSFVDAETIKWARIHEFAGIEKQ